MGGTHGRDENRGGTKGNKDGREGVIVLIINIIIIKGKKLRTCCNRFPKLLSGTLD